jgi:putative DNA primase/helicase
LEAGTDYDQRVRAAQAFLSKLDSGTPRWTFQTFDDSEAKRPQLARTLHGTLDEHLATLTRLNSEGAGVFVTINETDLTGRKKDNVTRVRAFWIDLDGAPLEPCRDWEEPQIIVQTSAGKWHAYWLVDGLERDGHELAEFEGEFKTRQQTLIAAFNSDKAVCDLPRVMRLPGFFHMKGQPFMVHEVDAGGFPAPWPLDQFDQRLEALAPKPPKLENLKPLSETFRIDTGTRSDRPTQAEVAEALEYISPDCGYKDWCDILMAIHDEFGDSGQALAEDWSRRSPKYKTGEVAAKWPGFTSGSGATITAIFARAKAAGCDVGALAKKHRPRPSGKRSNPRGTPKSNPGPDAVEITEDGVARHFTRTHKDTLRFDHDAGKWYEWAGDHWRLDGKARAFNYCRQAAHRASVDTFGKELTTARKASFAAGVERLAKADPQHAVTQDVWDNDPWALGVPGGVVDLRNGRLRPADPADMITKRTAVAPADRIDCPRWLQFLDEATGGDRDLIRFLQCWCGYSLTGVTREHALVFVYGGGGNGKSVFLNTLSGVLGDYATQASMDTFTASKHDRHPTDLAALRGARAVTASETEEGRAWAEARIKALTGGDKISARFMRQDFFEFIPQFKLIIAGNHRPSLRNIDEAMMRRLNIVPFTRKPATPDRDLENKLRGEFPGILRWMIEGCSDWQSNGLTRPDSVAEATATYFEENDLFGTFLEEQCEIERDNDRWYSSASELFKRWKEYALSAGDEPGSAKWLGENMARRGFIKAKKHNNGTREQCFIGVRLKQFGGMGD